MQSTIAIWFLLLCPSTQHVQRNRALNRNYHILQPHPKCISHKYGLQPGPASCQQININLSFSSHPSTLCTPHSPPASWLAVCWRAIELWQMCCLVFSPPNHDYYNLQHATSLSSGHRTTATSQQRCSNKFLRLCDPSGLSIKSLLRLNMAMKLPPPPLI